MILGFSKFNESILLSPGGNWEMELISNLDYDVEYLEDICQEIVDSGSSVKITKKILSDRFKKLQSRNDLKNTSMPTGWKLIDWYQAYQLNIYTGAKIIRSDDSDYPYKYTVDEIIKVVPSVVDVLKRLKSEFRVAVTKFDVSEITFLVLDTSKKIDISEIRFKPTKEQLQRMQSLNSTDPHRIADNIVKVSGGENSIFSSKVEGGNIIVSLRARNPGGVENLKAHGILMKIMRSTIDRINRFSMTKYEFSISGDSPWTVSFRTQH